MLNAYKMDITMFSILVGVVLVQMITGFLQTSIDTIQKDGIISIYMSHETYGVLINRDIALPFHPYENA